MSDHIAFNLQIGKQMVLRKDLIKGVYPRDGQDYWVVDTQDANFKISEEEAQHIIPMLTGNTPPPSPDDLLSLLSDTDKYKFYKTERGFRCVQFTDWADQLGGVQESSIATKSLLWLGKDGTDRLHITEKQARVLSVILEYFADTGMLPTSFTDL